MNLDENPIVDLYDPNGDIMSGYTGLTTCLRTQGVYEVTIPPITGWTTPCWAPPGPTPGWTTASWTTPCWTPPGGAGPGGEPPIRGPPS